jgi:hypothetical protein
MIALHREIVRSVFDILPAGSPPQPATDYAVTAEVRQTLRNRLGEHAAEDVIQRAQALIKGTPGLKEMRDNGLLTMGAEPFLLLAEHVRRSTFAEQIEPRMRSQFRFIAGHHQPEGCEDRGEAGLTNHV